MLLLGQRPLRDAGGGRCRLNLPGSRKWFGVRGITESRQAEGRWYDERGRQEDHRAA
jgi:hypothetical protein